METPCCAVAAENYNFGVGCDKKEEQVAAASVVVVAPETAKFGCGPCMAKYGAGRPKRHVSPHKAMAHRYRTHSPMHETKKKKITHKRRHSRKVVVSSPKRRGGRKVAGGRKVKRAH